MSCTGFRWSLLGIECREVAVKLPGAWIWTRPPTNVPHVRQENCT